jgi:hypothetical protein
MKVAPSLNEIVVSRRAFATNTLAAAVITLTSVASAQPAERPRPDDLSAPDWAEVQSRSANLLRVYGERLSPHEKERILDILTTNQRMLVSIRSFIVQNSDPAALTLRLIP